MPPAIYFGNQLTRQWSAVTAACLITWKSLFLDNGGFDAIRYPVAFNDVDFCLRLREQGQKFCGPPGAVCTTMNPPAGERTIQHSSRPATPWKFITSEPSGAITMTPFTIPTSPSVPLQNPLMAWRCHRGIERDIMKKNILFIHQSFPGQFGHLAKKLAEEGHRVTALALTPQGRVPGVSQVRYTLARHPWKDLPYLLQETDVKILRAESAAIAMQKLKAQGFTPDVVYAHPGWGEAMFVKEVWPDTRFVIYAEWFYNSRGQEVGFDPEFPNTSNRDQWRIQLKNTPFLHALNQADLAITPTQWQKSGFLPGPGKK